MKTTRKKTSIFWTTPKEEVIKRLEECDSLSEVLLSFGKSQYGGNHRTLKERLKYENIDIQIYRNKWRANQLKIINKRKPIEELLIEHSPSNRTYIKKRLFEEDLLENKCQICGLNSEWNGRRLSLQLDHINGVSNDNRIENLRILCPNCHTQTETFGTKQKKPDLIYKKAAKVYKTEEELTKSKNRTVNNLSLCLICGKQTSSSERCMECFRISRRIADRPDTKEDLLNLIKQHGYTGTGKLFKVSDNAIRKWLKSY